MSIIIGTKAIAGAPISSNWGGIEGNIKKQEDLIQLLDEKMDKESPVLVGTPTAPTAVAGSRNYQIANTEFVQNALDNVDALPDQTGHNGQYLTTNGTSASWGTINALQNTATGTNSLSILGNTTTNSSNTFIGYNSGNSGKTTSSNVCIGVSSGGIGTIKGSVFVGNYSGTLTSGDDILGSTGIGEYAVVRVNGAIQIGKGTNNEAGTMYVGLSTNGSTFTNYKLLGSDGKIPAERLTNALPSQSGQSGKFLTTNGTSASWTDVDLSNVVHKTGDETIGGSKTFTENLIIKTSGEGRFNFVDNDIEKSVSPSLNQYNQISFRDKNSKLLAGIESSYNTDKRTSIQMFVYDNTTSTGGYAGGIKIYSGVGGVYTEAPTPNEDTTSSTQIDTVGARNTKLQSYATKESPALTGTPTAPTASKGTNTTQIATTAFVTTALSNYSPFPTQSGQSGKFLTTNGTSVSWGTINALQNTATGTDGIAIGTSTAAVVSGTKAIGIGRSATASGEGSIAIGGGQASEGAITTASGIGSIAIGGFSWSKTSAAKATADYAIQLGCGTNNDANTLQVYNYKLLNSDGTIPAERLTNALQNTATGQSALTIKGTSTSETYAINIGEGSSVSTSYSIAIGPNAKAKSNSFSIAIGGSTESSGGVAIGSYAKTFNAGCIAIGGNAEASGWHAIQLGAGTNSEESTLYVGLTNTGNYKLLGSDGKIPMERLNIQVVNEKPTTPVEGMIYIVTG